MFEYSSWSINIICVKKKKKKKFHKCQWFSLAWNESNSFVIPRFWLERIVFSSALVGGNGKLLKTTRISWNDISNKIWTRAKTYLGELLQELSTSKRRVILVELARFLLKITIENLSLIAIALSLRFFVTRQLIFESKYKIYFTKCKLHKLRRERFVRDKHLLLEKKKKINKFELHLKQEIDILIKTIASCLMKTIKEGW